MSVEERAGLKKLFGIADSWRKEYENTAKNLENAVKVARKSPGTMGAMLISVLQAEAERQRSVAASLKRVATDLYQHEKMIEAQIATGPPTTGQLAGQLAGKGLRGAGRLAGSGLSAIGRRLSALEDEVPPKPLQSGRSYFTAPHSRLPIVDGKTVQRGLSMPGERVRKVPPGDYYLDARLMELRNVMNPNIHVRLNEFEVSYFKKRAH